MLQRLVLKDVPEIVFSRCAAHIFLAFSEACETQAGMGERVLGFVHLHLEDTKIPGKQLHHEPLLFRVLNPNLATQLPTQFINFFLCRASCPWWPWPPRLSLPVLSQLA